MRVKIQGFNGKRTEHQMGEGFTSIDTLRPTRDDCYMITKKLARFCSSQPSGHSWDFPFFWWFCCVQFRGKISLSIRQRSLFRKIPERQLMSESINFNSFSNISGLAHEPWRGANIDVSVQPVLHKSRPGFLAHWAVILNFNVRR